MPKFYFKCFIVAIETVARDLNSELECDYVSAVYHNYLFLHQIEIFTPRIEK